MVPSRTCLHGLLLNDNVEVVEQRKYELPQHAGGTAYPAGNVEVADGRGCSVCLSVNSVPSNTALGCACQILVR